MGKCTSTLVGACVSSCSVVEDDMAAEIAAVQMDDLAKSFEPAIVENNFFQCN